METIPGGSDAAKQSQPGIGEAQSEGLGFPQEQEGLAIVVGGQAIVLSPLILPDFPLMRVILGGQPSMPTEYQAMAMMKLIQIVIGRSKLKPEHLDIMKADPIVTYLAVSAAIERQLAILIS
jgi:hypothetical protein